MTKIKSKVICSLLALIITSLLFTGCASFFGKNPDITNYNDQMETSTGTWHLLDDEDTYFVFDGSKGAMTFSYYEDGEAKFSGKYRCVYRNRDDANAKLSFILTRNDKQKEDWVNCYVENFKEDFTQFSIMFEEEDQGVIDSTVYTQISA